MAKFERGLSENFIEIFNREYDKGEDGWLSNLVDDPEIFTAIRKEYISFYYRGGSLMKLVCKNDALVGKIHYKYLLKPRLANNENEYIEFNDGKIKNLEALRNLLHQDFNDIDALKRGMKPFAIDEKKHSHNFISYNKNVLDTEITINEQGKRSAIDLAIIKDYGNDAGIVFYEVKLFKNEEIHSNSGDPDVFNQLERYRNVLNKRKQELEQVYNNVCSNLDSLHGVVTDSEHRNLLKNIASGSKQLTINSNPFLIVTDFDREQKKGNKWKTLRNLLNEKYEGRYHLWGSSNKRVL